jgi:alkaline phosphatase D
MAHTFLDRREFLRITVVTAAATGVPSLLGQGCRRPPGETTAQVFPQGIASGDPRPDGVVLWARVEPASPTAEERVRFEVSGDPRFLQVVANGDLIAHPKSDHTVRVKVTGLRPFTQYYYRFVARGVGSGTGQTKTAPEPDQDVAVRFAVASGQDFPGRYYHGYKVLADQDHPVDFVLFLGDYIYETTEVPPLQVPTPQRKITLPDGLALDKKNPKSKAAQTLADYRALYKQYRSDPNLQRAHRLYPFITIWDDHEFANDCWQDHSVHFNEAKGDEKDTQRREAATQAWFEYIPTDLTYRPESGFPEDIKIYRSYRYGKHVDLLLIDQRYYRSDHVVPEGPVDLSVGKIAPFSPLGSRIFARKDNFDLMEKAVAPTMLGGTQLGWLIERLESSEATWKMICSQTIMAQMLVDLGGYPEVPPLFQHRYYFKLDQWDGYRSERDRILARVADLDNVVVLTDDIHAFYASDLLDDFDKPDPKPVSVEYIFSSMSSITVQEQTELVVESEPILDALGLGDLVQRFDEVLLKSNPHFKVSRSKDNGYGIVEVDRDKEIKVQFVIVNDVLEPEFPGEVKRIRMRTSAGSKRINVLDSD